MDWVRSHEASQQWSSLSPNQLRRLTSKMFTLWKSFVGCSRSLPKQRALTFSAIRRWLKRFWINLRQQTSIYPHIFLQGMLCMWSKMRLYGGINVPGNHVGQDTTWICAFSYSAFWYCTEFVKLAGWQRLSLWYSRSLRFSSASALLHVCFTWGFAKTPGLWFITAEWIPSEPAGPSLLVSLIHVNEGFSYP